ncbi:BgTH12-07745 [Blumeria graminis f. sp. triticale]|uniref:BgtE-6004 n=3 Tax=Blumeria graminis TaxID=34373 RepID=A0A061HIR1_BLUGR|nr:putative secreted effector protein [Blumeria graminis f. sp. tritici 96224]CAD6506518.1 BgTH12-07745 [Blumeria graminis f. sp. triticale]VDB96372.1 BgtE-6004 [Blumeria graminis f. sp. tritici]
MSCAIAILLNTVGRLVVTGLDNGLSHYGVYNVPLSYQFLVPEEKLGIHVSASQITQPGTHVVAYCSIINNLSQLVDVIIKDLPDITRSPKLSSSEHVNLETKCRSYIEKKSLAAVELSMSELKKDGYCTDDNLASLNFQGILGVSGNYSCFAAPVEAPNFNITADEPIRMESFLSEGELLRDRGLLISPNAMAWFQGHLHIFEQRVSDDDDHTWWYPLTRIGQEDSNAPIIVDFIYQAIPQISWFMNVIIGFNKLMVTTSLPSLMLNASQEESNKAYHNRNPENFDHPKYIYDEQFSDRRKDYIQFKFCKDTSKLLNNLGLPTSEYDESFGCHVPKYMSDEESIGQLKTIKLPPQSDTSVPAETFTSQPGKGWLCDERDLWENGPPKKAPSISRKLQ